MPRILHVFPFDPRHFGLSAAEWASDVPGNVWPLSALCRSRYVTGMSVHVIGARDHRYETGSMPVYEHRSFTSGPILRQYGDDWSLSLERRLRRLGPEDVCIIHQALEMGARLAHRAARNSRVILIQHGGSPLGWDAHLAAASRIVVLREDLAAQLRSHSADPAQIVTLPPSIDRELFKPIEHDFDDRSPLTLGFVGHVTHSKGALEIPNVLAHLLANGIDARVEFAGPTSSDSDEVRRALVASGLEQRGIFLGGMSNSQIARRMRTWRLMLAPSYSEGYSRAILEALATRLPVAVITGVNPAELERRPGIGAAARPNYARLVLHMLGDPHRPPPATWIHDHNQGAAAWDQLFDTLPPRARITPPVLLAERLRRYRRLQPVHRAERRLHVGGVPFRRRFGLIRHDAA